MLKIKRLCAFLIDYYLIIMLSKLLIVIIKKDVDALFKEMDLYIIMCLILVLFKDIIFKNVSIGKKILKLEIKTANSKPPSILFIILRNITIILWPIELILVILYNKRLGDMIFKTKVVETVK